MVERMLEGVEVRLNENFLEKRSQYEGLADTIVYTGMVDEYFGYCFGELEYRSLRFETEVLDEVNYQGNAVVNYTEYEVPYTRVIEHKHFEYGTQPKTVVTREYPQVWNKGDEPYYPVNDKKNTELYQEYKGLSSSQEKVIFGGRLGEYRYYDMDAVIASALKKCRDELGK